MPFPSFPPGLDEVISCIQQYALYDLEEQLSKRPLLINAEHASRTTPLFFAVRHQRPTFVDYLIKQGADVNPDLPGRVSLLEMADALPWQDVFDSLQAAGAKRKPARVRERETKPIYPTIAELQPADVALCRAVNNPVLFKKEAAKLPPRRVRDLLLRCCREREEELALRLIDVLPTMNFPFPEGRPLELACSSGSLQLVRAILAAGAKIDTPALFTAARRGHADVVRELMKHVTLHPRYGNPGQLSSTVRETAEIGYTAVAELLLPFSDPRPARSARQLITRYRRTYEDLVPECFDWIDDQ